MSCHAENFLLVGATVSKCPGPPSQGNEGLARIANALPRRGRSYFFIPSLLLMGRILAPNFSPHIELTSSAKSASRKFYVDQHSCCTLICGTSLAPVSQNEYLKSETLVAVSSLFTDLRREFPGGLHGALVKPFKI